MSLYNEGLDDNPSDDDKTFQFVNQWRILSNKKSHRKFIQPDTTGNKRGDIYVSRREKEMSEEAMNTLAKAAAKRKKKLSYFKILFNSFCKALLLVPFLSI